MRSNRPLSRSLIKLAVRLVAGKSRAHVQDWFPGLRLVAATPQARGAIYYRGQRVGDLICSAEAIRMTGSAIYIVGSGPSIRDCDLTRAETNSCILLNGALHLVPDHIAKPLAVAVEDERFVWNHFDLFERIPADCPCLFSVSVIRAICERNPRWLQGRRVTLIDDIRKPYGRARQGSADLSTLSHVRLSADGTAGLSTTPDVGVFQGGSVVISATQFALSFRPKSIGYLGIDISNADQARFYEKDEKVYSGVRKGQERILSHLEMAREFALEQGIEMLNYSPVSALKTLGFGYSDMFSRQKTN